MNEQALRLDMVEAGRRLYHKGMVAANDGNISARITDRTFLITPTGICKGDLSVEQLVVVDELGNVLSGILKPTSEMKMHLKVYANKPEVLAVVHAHPPKATAYAVAGRSLDRISLPEVVFSLGRIALAEYGTPSTDELPDAIARHLASADAILLSNHGALTLGNSVMDAYFKMETLEHFAGISLMADMLGGAKYLSPEQEEKLFQVRSAVFGKADPRR